MSQVHWYEVTVDWKQDRRGIMKSSVLNDAIEVATPPEFPKGIEGIWSPEHLFVAAINSCLMTTFLAIAENSKLSFKTFSSKATGKLETIDGKYMISEVILSPTVEVENEIDREKAERLLHKADAACLISNSVKSHITFQPVVKV